MPSTILEGYQHEAEFARAHNLNPCTVRRYRRQPDGLPWVQFGGRIYIDVDGAREWLRRQTRSSNPVRRDARAAR